MVLIYHYHSQRCSSKLLPLSIRFRKKPLFATVLLTFALSAVFLFSSSDIEPNHFVDVDDGAEMDFDGFNNETGATNYIVPNIIHSIRFNMTEYSFVDYLCLRAAYLRQRPDYIYIHTDVANPGNGGFRGKYWDMIKLDKKLMSSIRFLPIELASEIFGQPLSRDWRVYHGSDIARIRTMMKYGGIYLDNDVLVLQNLDKYRRFEISMNWDEGDTLGSQVIVAHKNARFLSRWLDSYHDYRADIWYYNAGDLPVRSILNVHPELLHRVKGEFGADSKKSLKHFTEEGYEGWRKNDAIHLLVNHLYSVKPQDFKPLVFDEEMIQTYKFPFGQMAREVLAALNETKTTV
uniref:Alpha-1,4-N-acetylglucosaminyltransferase n=1 Tax=Daphnia galeata TaxID=27404 RepID=A0A8J2RFI5_9CRUS|nr:unnamed protein product [Daphnia galeata]